MDSSSWNFSFSSVLALVWVLLTEAELDHTDNTQFFCFPCHPFLPFSSSSHSSHLPFYLNNNHLFSYHHKSNLPSFLRSIHSSLHLSNKTFSHRNNYLLSFQPYCRSSSRSHNSSHKHSIL